MKPEDVLLTPEEILQATQVATFLDNGELDPDCGYLRGRQQVAKVQLKKLVEWLEADCAEHPVPAYPTGTEFIPRRECDKCWQELRKIAGLEG